MDEEPSALIAKFVHTSPNDRVSELIAQYSSTSS
jgi:hypothetical protein